MFKYQDNGKQSKKWEKQHKVVTEVREVLYSTYHSKIKKVLQTKGWEVVKEVVVSSEFPLDFQPRVVGNKTISREI